NANKTADGSLPAGATGDGKNVDNAQTSEGSVSFAAAVGVGVATGNTTAGITGGTVTATGGAIDVTATSTHAVRTTADGSGRSASGGAVGVAVGVGVVDSQSNAYVGGTADLHASNVNVMGVMPASSFDTESTSGASAGGSESGFAGSLAINV